MFLTITDRGPNADAPQMGDAPTKIFVSPEFPPLLMNIRIRNDKAEATDVRPLHDTKGNINGFPLQHGIIGSTTEIPLNGALQPLLSDNRGLDTEGITTDGKGGYWLCDEYGPFLINIDATGKIRIIHGPDSSSGEKTIAGGLPEIPKWRQPNRGFEGLTRMPDGRIIAAVQSTLDIHGKNRDKALFTRLLAFNPETGKTAMYGYPVNSTYKKNSDAKIGDIVALDNNHILVIEQGKDSQGKMHNTIYKVSLADATDLSPFDYNDNYPELSDFEGLVKKGIILAKKTEVADLRQLGWMAEKAEGLALIDNQTIAIINDNDFGIITQLKNAEKGKKMRDYRVDNQGKLTLDGRETNAKIEVQPLPAKEAASELWLLYFPTPLI